MHESPPGVKRGRSHQRRRAFSPRMSAPVTGAVTVQSRKVQGGKIKAASTGYGMDAANTPPVPEGTGGAPMVSRSSGKADTGIFHMNAV